MTMELYHINIWMQKICLLLGFKESFVSRKNSLYFVLAHCQSSPLKQQFSLRSHLPELGEQKPSIWSALVFLCCCLRQSFNSKEQDGFLWCQLQRGGGTSAGTSSSWQRQPSPGCSLFCLLPAQAGWQLHSKCHLPIGLRHLTRNSTPELWNAAVEDSALLP